MALTASRTTEGFEPIGNMLYGSIPNPREYEMTPNTAFSKGDMVVLTNGLVAKAAAGATNVLGVMAEAFTTTTNASADRVMGKVYDNPFNIYRCTFASHRDAAATGGTTTTLVDTALSTSADNVWRSAAMYVYSGKAAGEFRSIKSYTGATDTLTVEKAFFEAPDTTSNYILLGNGGAANDAIGLGKIGVDLVDENTIDAGATTASEAGPLAVVGLTKDLIKDLMMDVIIRKHIYNTP